MSNIQGILLIQRLGHDKIEAMGKSDVARLINNFKPLHYDITIKPDKKSKTFIGSAIISGTKVGRPSKRITFHQNHLRVTKASVQKQAKDNQDIPIVRINHHISLQEVRLHSDTTIYPGNYKIELEFNGVISNNMSGLYPCFFTHKGKKKELIATQFESHHAREVFPSIDEPEAKATFDLTLHTPLGESVVANTPIKSQKANKNFLVTSFETTPRMSTYLLAFVYGEMGYKEAVTKNGTVVRAYATPDNVKLTDFALETAVKCLEFYNQYFDLPYPLPKCDMIALPDFANGAMENWGCITFREQCLLVDEKNSTLSTKQYVAMVVAHELAHQWFGNLVTMRWWEDLWLNEGFASWIEYMATDYLFPDWQMWTQFTIDEQQPALKLDALEHTHPIEVPVHHPDEIRTIFDTISYSKGSSVINMLHDYLGAEIFRDGLRHYLSKHAFGNTNTIDLWESLEAVSEKPVKDFMHSWTSAPGFPVLKANINTHKIVLTQNRFQVNPMASASNALWPIPLESNTPIETSLLTKRKVSLSTPTQRKELQFNFGRSGFYRVSYNKEHIKNLGVLISKDEISSANRLGLLSDVFETAKAGHTETVDGLKFLNNFAKEDDYAVWDVIAGSIGSIRLLIVDDATRDAMKPYVRRLVSTEFKRLGWNRQASDSHFDRLLRPLILGMAASADEKSIVQHCQKLFTKLTAPEQLDPDLREIAPKVGVAPQEELDPDVRGVVFGTVARLGGQEEFNKLLKLHNEAALSEERTVLCAALTGFRHPEIVKQALGCIQTSDVRMQDVLYWLAYSFMNRHARDLTWEWLKSNWEWLYKSLADDIGFSRLPIYASRVFTGQAFINDYRSFFELNMSPTIERAVKQGIEMLEWQTAWRERDSKAVKSYFNDMISNR